MAFYEGGLTYREARNTSYPELFYLSDQASRIGRERKRAMDRARGNGL